MLHINDIRENKDSYIKLLAIKNIDVKDLVNSVIVKDDERKEMQLKIDQLLTRINQLTKEIGELYKKGKKDKAEILKQESISIKAECKSFQSMHEKNHQEIKNILLQIPNVPHPSVPKGYSEEDNIVIKESGNIPELIKEAKPHWDLVNQYNLIDFKLGNKITGAGFPVYTDKGAKLQRALINYFIDKNIDAGYVEYLPPHLVNRQSGIGTGQLPKFEDDLYKVNDPELYLIPTAEVPLTNLFRDLIVKDLPIKCTGYTPCFRREAGSYGKEVRGLNRLHQFDKVEIVQIDNPLTSYDTLDNMVDHITRILDELILPYRVVKLCGGDLSFSSSLTYDLEVYSAGQKKWLEVSSISNFESFQANRLKLRYKDKKGRNQLCHTLNGSALALPRIYAALIENNQEKDGIRIPKVLHSYTGFDKIY